MFGKHSVKDFLKRPQLELYDINKDANEPGAAFGYREMLETYKKKI